MRKILLAGAGQIGSRYLQGLVKCKSAHNITVLDPSEDALKIAKMRFAEAGGLSSPHKISYVNCIADLCSKYDLAIIATSSFPRCSLIYELNNASDISYWIIEKVLAPSLAELNKIQEITNKSAGVWVNHWLRLQPWTEIIKSRLKLQSSKHLEMAVSGGDLGIACNGTHFIDLLVWLTGEKVNELKTDQLEKIWFDAKRVGYFEVNGALNVELSNDINARIISERSKELTSIKFTWSDDYFILIVFMENAGFQVIENGNVVNNFEPALQSGWMTSSVVNQILDNNQCGLATLHESIEIHDKFLKSLISHWNACNKVIVERIPIT